MGEDKIVGDVTQFLPDHRGQKRNEVAVMEERKRSSNPKIVLGLYDPGE